MHILVTNLALDSAVVEPQTSIKAAKSVTFDMIFLEIIFQLFKNTVI